MSVPPSPEEKGNPQPLSLDEIERIKLLATYVNNCSTSLFTVGVAAPSAAAVFGLAGNTYPFAPLTLAIGMPIFFSVSLFVQSLARSILRKLKS